MTPTIPLPSRTRQSPTQTGQSQPHAVYPTIRTTRQPTRLRPISRPTTHRKRGHAQCPTPRHRAQRQARRKALTDERHRLLYGANLAGKTARESQRERPVLSYIWPAPIQNLQRNRKEHNHSADKMRRAHNITKHVRTCRATRKRTYTHSERPQTEFRPGGTVPHTEACRPTTRYEWRFGATLQAIQHNSAANLPPTPLGQHRMRHQQHMFTQ